MKEATGELSNAIVVGVCVAVLVAFFYFTIWPIIDANFKQQTACEQAVCEPVPFDDEGHVKCKVKGSGNEVYDITCNYKG